ncbi:MAG: serine/threonine-protein kinase [Pirellulales bacterium]
MAEDLTPAINSDVTASEVAPAVVDDLTPLADDRTVISTEPLLAPIPFAARQQPSELGRSLIGLQLGDIVLEEYVGGGGMGAVFRGTDTRLQRTVAVKVLATPQTADADSHGRFEMEARSAARLDHPNIARVHYVGEEQGHRYLVFEYIEGTNLRDLVYASGPFPLAEALRCMLQVTDALMHASQRDVVHRDIKPSNILLTADGQAKLVDMGLARVEPAGAAEHELTTSGVTLGTFDYMAPEQARDARLADVRSDIYSLGCTFYFMLAGQPPFPDGTALQKLLAHQSGELPNVARQRPDVPESVVDILETMLAKRPEDRFQSPAELMSALIAVSEQQGVTYPQASLPIGWTARPAPTTWLRRHSPWVVPAALLLLSVLVLGIVWHRQQPAPAFQELRLESDSGGNTGTSNREAAETRLPPVETESPR